MYFPSFLFWAGDAAELGYSRPIITASESVVECFCAGSEAVNASASGEAVRGLVKRGVELFYFEFNYFN